MSLDQPLGKDWREPAGRGMHVVDGVLIAPAPNDFDDRAFVALKKEILAKVHGESLRAIVIDVSSVLMLDSATFAMLANTARMLGLLGARVVFVGFQPGVVSTLVDLDVDTSGLTTATCLEDALDILNLPPRLEDGPEAADEPSESGEPDEPEKDNADV